LHAELHDGALGQDQRRTSPLTGAGFGPYWNAGPERLERRASGCQTRARAMSGAPMAAGSSHKAMAEALSKERPPPDRLRCYIARVRARPPLL
jgi:hypothetical protein